MDSRYRFLTSGIPWTQSMPSCDVNAATRLAEASWRRDNFPKWPSSAPLHTLSKLYNVSVSFVVNLSFEAVYFALFAVAEGWLLLDIG